MMKKWMLAILTISLCFMLFNFNVNKSYANEVTAVDSIELKQNPYLLENGWTVDGNYTNSEPNSLVKGNNEYIAIGNYGTVMKSKDGKNWTTLTKFANYQLTSITYNGEYYILAGANTTYGDDAINTASEIFISKDGLSWEEVTFEYNDAILYLEASKNEIIASGKKGLYHSTDGRIWTQKIEHKKTYYYHPLHYVNGTYFLEVFEDNQIYTSKDGIKWTKHKYDADAGVTQFTWYEGQYIGIGYGIFKSNDGVKWAKVTNSPNDVLFRSIATDGKKLVMMGKRDDNSPDLVVYSGSSLTSLTKKELKNFGHAYHLVYPVADGFAGIGFNVNSSNYAMYSKDGLNWSHKLLGASSEGFNGIAFNGKRAVAVGALGNIVYSDNGQKWHSANALPSHADYDRPYFNAIEYGANKFVAVGNDEIYTSNDGLSWSKVSGFGHDQLIFSELIWTGKYFLAAGQTSGVYYSTDGLKWSKVNSVSKNGQWLMSMVYDGKKVVAGFQMYNNGNQYIQMMQSTDGKTWSNLTTFKTMSIEVAYNGEAYIAVDPYQINNFWTSKDAKNWSKVDASFAKGDNFYMLSAFENQFVVFNNSIMKIDGEYVKRTNYYSSKDGKVWKKHELPARQDEHIFGDEMLNDGIKAFGKYTFVGAQGYILTTTDLNIEDPINITANGLEVKQSAEVGKAYIDNGVTYLPLRVIGEALGFAIDWNSTEKSVTFKNDVTSAKFSGVKIKDGLSYVPLRKVSEQLGYEVNYLKENNNVYVDIIKK